LSPALWFDRYTLTRRDGSGVREGALLRVGSGFADVHPWPSLGDAPLDEQLALLARGETTPLTRASLRLAQIDGEARERGVSLFTRDIPLSHWPGADPPPSFDTAKLKDVSHLPECRLRIDFNCRLTPSEFLEIAATLPRERIDFIEDPVPYDAEVWRSLREQTGLRLAVDRGAGTADVLVFKPALQTEWPAFDGEIVVTSYMDHPVGQFGAAYVASMQDAAARCGLFTHVLYEPNAFIEAIASDGARLLPPRGTGIGFDELLERLPWRKLA
jgi:O-succinylbenzoate synthase